MSLEFSKNNLKLIQQTPADPASIEVREPIFDDLNFNLGRMEDTCSLEKVDLPGNQFNKATQVKLIDHSHSENNNLCQIFLYIRVFSYGFAINPGIEPKMPTPLSA